MITRGATDRDSNRAQKIHGRIRSLVIGETSAKSDMSIIKFGAYNLEDVVSPHNNALVIRATVTNYDIARVH